MNWIALVFFIFLLLDTYLVFLIGMKLVKRSESYFSKTIWIPAVILSVIATIEKVFLLAYLRELSLLNLVFYFIFVFLFFKVTWKNKLIASITMLFTLIITEMLGAIVYQIITGNNPLALVQAGYNNVEVLMISVPVTLAKLVVLMIVLRWKVRAVESV